MLVINKKCRLGVINMCKYCENGIANYWGETIFEQLVDHKLFIRIFEKNGIYYLNYGELGGENFKICFCPMCGRRLGDE